MNVIQLLDQRVAQSGDEALFEYKIPPHSDDKLHINQWKSVTAREFRQQVDIIGNYLLELGLNPGDTLAILARSTYYTVLLDFAAIRAQIVVVPIYETSSTKQIAQIADEVGAKYIYVHNQKYSQNVPDKYKKLQSYDISQAIVNATSTEISQTNHHLKIDKIDVNSINPETIVAILYTAGLNSKPTAIRYSHSDYIANASPIQEVLQLNFATISKETTPKMLNFLSLAHIAPRAFMYGAILSDCIIGITPGVREIIADLQHFKPHFFLSVPRVYDRLYAQLVDNAPSNLFGISYRRNLKLAFSELASNKFISKIQQLLGGQLQFTFSTAVKPDPELIHLFTNLQIPSYDCYFVTESKGIVAMNTPQHNQIGTVGQVLGHREVKIIDDVIKIDGFATGDLGELDTENYLTINGHKKDVIITSSGRSILPEPLQQALATDPMINDVLVIGERRPYLTALIALNPEHVQKVMEDCNIDVDSVESAVMIDKLVQKAVNNTNKIAAEDEKIVRYAILEDGFPARDDFISGSLKLRRDTLCKHYKQLINEVLYA